MRQRLSRQCCEQAAEALQESEEKFAKAFRATPDALTISTLDEGRLIDKRRL